MERATIDAPTETRAASPATADEAVQVLVSDYDPCNLGKILVREDDGYGSLGYFALRRAT